MTPSRKKIRKKNAFQNGFDNFLEEQFKYELSHSRKKKREKKENYWLHPAFYDSRFLPELGIKEMTPSRKKVKKNKAQDESTWEIDDPNLDQNEREKIILDRIRKDQSDIEFL